MGLNVPSPEMLSVAVDLFGHGAIALRQRFGLLGLVDKEKDIIVIAIGSSLLHCRPWRRRFGMVQVWLCSLVCKGEVWFHEIRCDVGARAQYG